MEVQQNRPLITQIFHSISGFHKHLIKTDKYPYKTLPYLEIFFEWAVKIIKSTSGNQSPAQSFHELTHSDPQFHTNHSLHIFTDASKSNTQCATAFYIPQLLSLIHI